MLPVIVAMDGFVTSHTQMVVDLPTQEQVDAFLPQCVIPHGLKHDHPTTFGGLTWPSETELHRAEIQQAMEASIPALDEARDEFEDIFGRRPAGVLEAFETEDAETIMIACNTHFNKPDLPIQYFATFSRTIDPAQERNHERLTVQIALNAYFQNRPSARREDRIKSNQRIDILTGYE